MLTKEERAAIAERLKDINDFCDRTLYTAITGKSVPRTTRYNEDVETMIQVILDLCDTSNMIDLPLDKDGKVIHVGDIVYYGSTIYMVKKIIYNGNEWEIQFFDDKLCISIYAEPNDLTRKKPVTIASLVEQIRDILDDDDDIAAWTFSRLAHIADQLESLGDSDD